VVALAEEETLLVEVPRAAAQVLEAGQVSLLKRQVRKLQGDVLMSLNCCVLIQSFLYFTLVYEVRTDELAVHVKRPNFGTAGRVVKIKVNSFGITVPNSDIFHYDGMWYQKIDQIVVLSC